MIYMMVGIQGSGKSTLAKKIASEENIEIISTDKVRQNNPGIAESLVWPTVYEKVANACKENRNAIFDATSVTKKVRKRFFDSVEAFGVHPSVGIYNFLETPETCRKRVELRNQDKNELFLPIEVIQKFADTKEEPTLDEGFEFIKNVINGEIVETITK